MGSFLFWTNSPVFFFFSGFPGVSVTTAIAVAIPAISITVTRSNLLFHLFLGL